MKLLMFVSAASSKDVPCKGESLGNHLEGLEIQLRHFNDRAGKVGYFHFTCAIERAGMFLQTDKTVISLFRNSLSIT